MKKRLIALFLCSALIFGMVPTVLAEALGNDKLYINYNGATVSTVSYAMSKDAPTVKLDAMLAESASGTYQWQLRVPAGGKWTDLWIDLPGMNGASVNLSYGMVGQFMVDGKAQVRVTFTEGNNTLTSDEVSLSFTQEAPETEEKEAAKPEVIAPGSVENVTIQAPSETPKTETPKAEEPKAEEPKAEEPETEEPETEEPKTEEPPAEEPPAEETPAEETPAEGEGLKEKIEGFVENIKEAIGGATTLDNADTPVASADTPTPQDANAGGLEGNYGDTNSGDNSGSDTTPDVKKTYNIVINYIFENNTIVSDPYTASLAEGSSFSATVTFPTVQGYLPYVNDVQQDSMALNYASVTENVTINVVYKPTNVNYTVIHYQQNVNDDNYTIESQETKQGLTGSQVPKVDKTYEGFYSLLYERPAIAADGSTVIEVYYDRYYYLLNFDMDGGYGTEPVYARYGASIGTVTEPTKAGYSFAGWSETEGGTNAVTLPTTMPAESKTYYAIWEVDSTAKVTVVFWGENADDEGYSYLADATKVINLKPGKEFTYSEDKMLVCDKEVHTHTDDCLNCDKEEHTHSALGGSCYTLTCTTESHTHSTSCYAGVGSESWSGSTGKPNNPSEGQVYSGRLGTYIYIKGTWYDYTGSTASGSVAPTTCGKEEVSHTHTDSCYTLTCNKEAHTHDTKCYSCGKEEHNHTSDCYMQGAGLDSNLWKFVKSDTITVAADGSSVVNVYYDRTEKTLTFKYSYKRNSYQKTETITAKWGQNIATEYNAIVKDAGSTFWSANSNYSGPYTNYFGVMPTESKTYYYQSDDGSSGTMKYYGEDLNGNYVEMFSVSNVGGYTVTVEDHYEFKGFTYDHGTENGKSCSGAAFYYKRNSYNLTFNDQYTDVKKESVKYEAPLSTYKDYVPEVPSAYEPGSVEFGGWYQNPQCTGEEFKLDEHTMPSHDIILYAKWVPVTHTVKFYLTEQSESIYKPAGAEDAASFEVPHGDNIAEEYVKNHLEKSAMNEAKPNGSYEFVMWYYYENGDKKPFDPTTQIRKDLTLYGEWSSNALKQYTVQYVLKDDHSVKVADDLTGSGLAGTTKTFDAKGGTELYAACQEGYFPTVQSQSLLLDIDAETLTITFEYVPVDAVPYTVKYVEKDTGKSLADDKVVDDNRKAVVTETFKPISGYMPDAYQKRLVVTAEGENILYFYYTKDETHAYYKITHYTQNTDGTTWTEYASSQAVGDIGTRYTSSPMTIPGFTYQETKYVVDGKEVTDVTAEGAALTADGLEINLYYVRNKYPYVVKYLEYGTDNQLHDPKSGTGLYGQVISESALTLDGYEVVGDSARTLNIQIDEGDDAPTKNIIVFYYKEQEVTINYVAVGPEGATNFGSVTPTTETVKVNTGTAQGSTPTAGDGFKFVGWYLDKGCTIPVTASWVDANNKLVPEKNSDGKNVTAIYYAKFEYDITSLTIQKTTNTLYDENEKFIFTVTNSDGSWKQTVVVPANGTTTINGLKVGETFTITEDSSWAWRYDVAVEEGESSTVTLKAESNTVAFKNTLKNNKWLTDDAYAKNNFTK